MGVITHLEKLIINNNYNKNIIITALRHFTFLSLH